MKKFWGLPVCLGLLAGAPAHALVIDITVTPWVAPRNIAFSDAGENAAEGLYQGLSAFGTPGTPGYFEAEGSITSHDIISSPGFPSWRGTANPGVAFGPAFAFENGNRALFGVSVVGADSATFFSASDLRFSAFSTLPLDVLRVNSSGGFNYSPSLMGVLYGLDGVLGGGDDLFVTSGASDTPVNALFGAGRGNGFLGAGCSTCTLAQQQFGLDFLAGTYDDPMNFTGMYEIAGNSGSGTFRVGGGVGPAPVPEPATLLLFLAGLTGMGLAKRRFIT